MTGKHSEMMKVCWKEFSFHAPTGEEKQVDIPGCPRCFADLIFPQH